MYSKSKIKCFKCGKLGHKRAECKSERRNNENRYVAKAKVSTTNAEKFIFVAHSETGLKAEVQNSLIFYLDSGATDHMVNDEKYLTNCKVLDNPIQISVAKNGIYLMATKIGTISGNLHVNEKKTAGVIEDVLFVKELSCNLLSIRKLESKGIKTIFENGKAQIWRGKNLLTEAVSNGKLYELRIEVHEVKFAGISAGKCLELWHQRMGHLNIGDILKLKRAGTVDGLDVLDNYSKELFCESCVAGKQHRRSHKSKSGSRSSRPLELIHSDVVGPITPTTYDNKRYVVIFTDDFTHFAVACLMEGKHEVLSKFTEYTAWVTAHFERKISRLRVDNGGEYSSNNFKKFCAQQGIRLEYTTQFHIHPNKMVYPKDLIVLLWKRPEQ